MLCLSEPLHYDCIFVSLLPLERRAPQIIKSHIVAIAMFRWERGLEAIYTYIYISYYVCIICHIYLYMYVLYTYYVCMYCTCMLCMYLLCITCMYNIYPKPRGWITVILAPSKPSFFFLTAYIRVWPLLCCYNKGAGLRKSLP